MSVSRVTHVTVSRGRVGAARVIVRRDRAAAAPASPAQLPAPRYERMAKAELQARAAALGLSTDGTNAALIERIKGKG